MPDAVARLAVRLSELAGAPVELERGDARFVLVVDRWAPRVDPVEPLPIDSTLAGRVFQHLDVLSQRRPNGDVVLWLPLLDGSERLGVLAVTLSGVVRGTNKKTVARSGNQEERASLELFRTEVAHLVVPRTRWVPSPVTGEGECLRES